MTPEAWCEYVHMNKCTAGIQREWWFSPGRMRHVVSHLPGYGQQHIEVDEPEETK